MPQLVSILVPVYNHAAYMRRCLDSILADDYPRKELILIDDGSSDGSYTIAQAWLEAHGSAFERVVIKTQPNAGLTATLNRLVQASRGTYLAGIASDDYLLPGSLGIRVTALEAHPDWLGVFGDCVVVDGEGQLSMASGLVDLHGADKAALSQPRLMPAELVLNWSVPGPVLMVRREAYCGPEGVGLFDERLLIEDRDLYLRLLATGRLGFLDRPVAAYRWHGSNSCTNPERKLAHMRELIATERRHLRHFSAPLAAALWLNSLCLACQLRMREAPGPIRKEILRNVMRLRRLILRLHRIRAHMQATGVRRPAI